MTKSFAALILVCAAAHAGIIEPNQIWTSGPTVYEWVLTADYGYLPIATDGEIVTGITFGFNPMPLDGNATPNGVLFNNPAAPLPPESPTTQVTESPAVITPEPSEILVLLIGIGLIMTNYQRQQVKAALEVTLKREDHRNPADVARELRHSTSEGQYERYRVNQAIAGIAKAQDGGKDAK